MMIFAILSLLMAVAILIFVVWLNFEIEKTIKEFDTMQYLLSLTYIYENENNIGGGKTAMEREGKDGILDRRKYNL